MRPLSAPARGTRPTRGGVLFIYTLAQPLSTFPRKHWSGIRLDRSAFDAAAFSRRAILLACKRSTSRTWRITSGTSLRQKPKERTVSGSADTLSNSRDRSPAGAGAPYRMSASASRPIGLCSIDTKGRRAVGAQARTTAFDKQAFVGLAGRIATAGERAGMRDDSLMILFLS
jgi:hypothetical protein